MNKLILPAFFFMLISCNPVNQTAKDDKLNPLDRLKTGNERFVKGYPVHPDETLQRIRNLKKGQHPFAVVVGCSDSRVPPELVFDQGFGDIFIIRTAGNVIGDYELGSIEYAVEHLQCKLVVVLGHEKCGAIEAYLSSGNQIHHDHIQNIIDYIANEDEEKIIADSLKTNTDLAIRANIKHGVATLKNSLPVLKNLVAEKKLIITGAYYDLDTGEVIFDE